ncbi:MAG: hypothetical protein ACRDNZ_16910 [Streptosporangiaceae bacterium]
MTAALASLLEGLAFSLDGEEFTCEGALSLFRLSDLARRARQAADGDPEARLVLVAESFRMVLGDGEYARFAAHLAGHGTPDHVVAGIAEHLDEEIARRLPRRPR